MGCVSSTLLNQDEDFPQMGTTSALGHHIVSLTSTTYGLLSLDPPPPSSPMTPPLPLPRFTLSPKSLFPPPSTTTTQYDPTEVINSWELMAGLDSTTTTPESHNHGSFRFSPLPNPNPKHPSTPKFFSKENSNPNTRIHKPLQLFPDPDPDLTTTAQTLEQYPYICPPNGENKLVIYTTTLRGVRKTFEDCNAVRSVLQGLGFGFCERDISMDRGFREELKQLLVNKNYDGVTSPPPPPQLPRVFIKGRYIGGAEEVLKIHEEGGLVELLRGIQRVEAGRVCDGCGGVRFLPCFRCHGSCKVVMVVKEVNIDNGNGNDNDNDNDNDDDDDDGNNRSNDCSDKRSVVIRCSDCNENGLVLCPICS